MFNIYEDEERLNKHGTLSEFTSPYQDFRYYYSSVQPQLKLAMNVIKPTIPSYILIQLHGWHMSMPKPEIRYEPLTGNEYVLIQVDMRGRAFSDGLADCNALELMDIADAVHFVRKEYKNYIIDPEIVYLEGGSGGGGNVLAMLGKFPDLFSAASALYGISDYALWYEQDTSGEFRDEMDVWIGCSPEDDADRYRARSGLYLVSNVLTPLYMAHGDMDERVPIEHTRMYVDALKSIGKEELIAWNELAGVGGRGHLDNCSDETKHFIALQSNENRKKNCHAIFIPPSGQFYVGGYLFTKHFQVTLENVHAFAAMSYDCRSNSFTMRAKLPYMYKIVCNDGMEFQGQCVVE